MVYRWDPCLMPLNFDTERLPGDANTLLDLVCAIVESSDEHGERSWIEWKSSLDLGSGEGWFKLAKEILAMANRDVERARDYCHGWGYIVVGASEEELHGIASPTSTSKIEQALAPYLGTGRRAPRWEPQLLDVDGHQILVVGVEPPREGDPIYTLGKGFGNFLPGSVFARGIETAGCATPDQMMMLQHRLVSRGARDVVMERIALVCSSQGWEVEFESAIPADRAFAWVTHQTQGVPVSVWVEFVESGHFPRHDAVVEMFRTMVADHALVVIPEWADIQQVDRQVAALLQSTYGEVHADAGPFIGICSGSFGGIHTALRTLINLGREGTAFPRMNLRAYRVPVQRPWR